MPSPQDENPQPSQLCNPCLQIGIKFPASREIIKTPYWKVSQVLKGGESALGDLPPIGSFCVASRRSKDDHAQSAKDGCLLCELLCFSEKHWGGTYALNFNCQDWSFKHAFKWEDLQPHYDIHTVRLYIRRKPHADLTPAANKQKMLGALTLDAHTEEDDPAALHITSRRLDPDITSKRSFERAKQWLQSCTQRHDAHADCPEYLQSLLPKRVIDVASLENPEFLRLSQFTGKRGDYVALSYCWGGPQEAATTSINIVSRTKEFKLSTLPQTLQDAVMVTRRLGLRFLWVDAMCILQDSPSDKDVQMANMSHIYKDAFVTIIAGSSTSCHQGFLEKRSSKQPKLVPKPEKTNSAPLKLHEMSDLNIPYSCPDGTLGTLILTKSKHSGPHWSESEEPIYTRAWALQERLLSPRVLFYASDRLVFRCQKTYIINGMNKPDKTVPSPQLLDPIFFSSPPSLLKALKQKEEEGTLDLASNWPSIVGTYSRCSLTVSTDKLLGLSGLAAEYHRLTHDRYFAGLWASSLPISLMWKPTDRTATLSPSKQYCAPSWSWASIDGGINLDIGDVAQDIDFVDCSMILKSRKAPFGEVTGGTMIVKGRVMRAKLPGLAEEGRGRCKVDISWWPRREENPDFDEWNVTRRQFRQDIPPDEEIGTVTFDRQDEGEGERKMEKEIWLLKVYIMESKDMVGGLAITPVKERSWVKGLGMRLGLRQRRFRRVGTFLMDYFQEDCFQFTKPEIVHLV